jgi:ABC-type microcin C transport system duplicated ATPase subunit YejF
VNQLAADRKADQSPLLRVRGLNVSYGSTERPVRAVADADLAIYPGEIVGVAGESGSGKTTLCTAMLRALPSTARIGGSVDFAGRSLFDLNEAEMRRLRGRDIAMILQNPMTSLDPLFTIGNQLGEVLQTHQPKLRGSAARERATELLRRVHITAPESRLRQYPHQMSRPRRSTLPFRKKFSRSSTRFANAPASPSSSSRTISMSFVAFATGYW